MRALLAAALVAAMPGQAHAGACRMMGLDGVVMSHPADTVPSNGGLIVGYGAGDGYGDGDPSVQKEWRLLKGKKKVAVTMTTLAPGLTLYTAKVKGKAKLVDGDGKKLGTFKFGGKKAMSLDAPALKSADVATQQMQRRGSSTRASVAVKDIPADAFAIIIYDHDSGAPITWAEAQGQQLDAVYVYASPGRCSSNPPGMTAPYKDEVIEAAWVDRFGRVSAHSSTVKVTDSSSATTTGP